MRHIFNVFEQPWTLIIAAAVATLALLIFRRSFPEKQRWWQWLLPVFLFAAAFGLDRLVKTDTEKIREVIHTATKAVEEENIAAIEAIISERYSDSYHSTKKDLMYHCKARLSEPLIEKNITRIVSIEVLSPRATAIFTMRIFFDKQSYIAQLYKQEIFTKVQLELQKEQDSRWRIISAEILEIDRQPFKWENIEQVRW